jgi:signal peptidase I
VDDAAHQVRLEWASAAAQEAELARQSEVDLARREAEQQAEVARLAAAVRDAEAALRLEAERRLESERRLAELEQRLALVETARSAAPEAAVAPVAPEAAVAPVAPVIADPIQPPLVVPEPELPPAAQPARPTPEPVDQSRKPAELSAATAARWPAPPVAAAPLATPDVESDPPVMDPDPPRIAEPPPGAGPPVPRHAVALPASMRPGGEAPHTRRTGRLVLRLTVMVVVAALAAVLLRTFVIASYYIPSASMEPTLHGCPGCNNDHVLVNKLSYHLHSVHRGDVVVFHRPAGAPTNEKVLIKRVIGLPGDVLTDRNDVIYVDGRPLHEPYLNPACAGTQNFPSGPVTVPTDEVYVMGDNRCDSSDSRVFGAIPESSIIGRAFVIVWPLGRLHYL